MKGLYFNICDVCTQGVVQECLTEDNSCYFTQTVCGRHYYFAVYSVTGQCKSQISSTVDIRTGTTIRGSSAAGYLNLCLRTLLVLSK